MRIETLFQGRKRPKNESYFFPVPALRPNSTQAEPTPAVHREFTVRRTRAVRIDRLLSSTKKVFSHVA
jgi:hypothetical protein